MSHAPRVLLDFASARPPRSRAGAALLVVGIAALAGIFAEYRSVQGQRAGLEIKLAAVLRQSQHTSAQGSRAARATEEASRVARELGTPWTTLLAELEAASRESQGKIALLSIEPDHAKHRVHITGESRDLSLALAYVQRLQGSSSMRYPMLESHEVQTGDAERPIRFALTAEWRELP